MAGAPIDLIYLDPETADYHTGHCRIFANGASSDPRIRSIHFVLSPAYQQKAPDVLRTIGASPKMSVEFCTPEFVQRCDGDAGGRSIDIGRARWAEARRQLELRPGATVFDTPFDFALGAAALDRRPMPGKVTGVVFFCAEAIYADGLAARAKLLAKYFLARRPDIPIVFTFDDVFLDRAPKAITRHWRKVFDPLPLTAAQLQRLLATPPAKPRDRVEFVVIGSIAGHKGVFESLEALRLIDPDVAARVRLRFVGAYSAGADERAKFLAALDAIRAGTSADVVFDEGFATEDALIDALARADVMLAARRRHPGVSHNFVWSAAAGRPVVSQDYGWMGHMTRELGLGVVCDPRNPADIARAVTEMAAPGRRAAYQPAAPRAWAARHTADAYYDGVISALTGMEAGGTGAAETQAAA